MLAGLRGYFLFSVPFILLGYWVLNTLVDLRKFTRIRMVFKWGWFALYALAGTQMFFAIFEGVIQAFVVAMLTMTYLSVIESTQTEGEQAA